MPKYAIGKVIEALRRHHGLLVLTADELGCSRQTLYNYAERYPVVAAVLAEERERFVDLAEQGLYHHLEEKSPWAIALVLKTLGRERGYGDKGPTPAPPSLGEALDGNPEWYQLLATLHATLADYPEAKWAVVHALNGHAHESSNGHAPGA
jgi:hypothetical protein